jgi:hypothetical protein
MSIVNRVLTHELLANSIKHVAKLSVVLFPINLTKAMTIHIKFRKYHISNTFLLNAQEINLLSPLLKEYAGNDHISNF